MKREVEAVSLAVQLRCRPALLQGEPWPPGPCVEEEERVYGGETLEQGPGYNPRRVQDERFGEVRTLP